mmetsp:Transcript_14525/g.23088  ORF Transcript_14525/g.23088 Transcript_14525/m.23088 type:complete len:333 (-) Transcript_14525:336-1334(-)
MGACCSLLLGKHKSYEKVTAQEGKHTGLELQEASTDLGATRKERTVSGGRLDGSLPFDGKKKAKRKFGGSTAPTLAPPPEDLERMRDELRVKLRKFFKTHNPSQANPKSLAHIVSFYTSFDTIATLNSRLKDKYGVDLTSVEEGHNGENYIKFGGAQSSDGQDQTDALPPSPEVKMDDEGGGLEGTNVDDAVAVEQSLADGGGQVRETRADSALQRAAMFEQTWQSSIPTEKVKLISRADSKPVLGIEDLRGALASGRMTLVASGETNGNAKAYFYTLSKRKNIVLFELLAEMDENTGQFKEYNLLCKFTEQEALEEAMKTVKNVLGAEEQT